MKVNELQSEQIDRVSGKWEVVDVRSKFEFKVNSNGKWEVGKWEVVDVRIKFKVNDLSEVVDVRIELKVNELVRIIRQVKCRKNRGSAEG